MHLPKGIDGLKEIQEERENEKMGLHINNSFLTVQANYTFTEEATLVCMNPILEVEPGHDWLFERDSHGCTMRILLQLSPSVSLRLYLYLSR